MTREDQDPSATRRLTTMDDAEPYFMDASPQGTMIEPEFAVAIPMLAVADRDLVRLAPDSAIQFIDFVVAADAASVVRRRFLEDPAGTFGSDGAALHSVTLEDGVIYHPVTNDACDATLTYSVDGIMALDAFANGWVPLPILRVLGGTTDGSVRLDEGPSNWARLHVHKTIEPDTAMPVYRLTLALDTRLAPALRAHSTASTTGGPTPTREDAAMGTTFRFASHEIHLGNFVTEAWIDDWIAERFTSHKSASQMAQDDGATMAVRALEHLAHYLTLLNVLADHARIPEITFIDEAGRGVVPVDLILDLGHARTVALVAERGRETGLTELVSLRDLSKPWLLHHGVFPSTLEFSKPNFGNEALSRWSGRSNAFYWPSLARIGVEAARLSAGNDTPGGPSGLASVPTFLWDHDPSDQVWRFNGSWTSTAGTGAQSNARGPMLSGPQLGQVSESGELVAGDAARTATTKPRFSRSSLTTFFIGELILQAMASINAAVKESAGDVHRKCRRISRIVLTPPAGLHADERALLIARVEAAAHLVTASLTDGSPVADIASTIDVVLAPDTASAGALALLHDQILAKFSGDAAEYFELMGRRRPLFKTGPCVRIASLDIGYRSTSLSVATFAVDSDGSIARSEQIADGFDSGLDRICRAIAAEHVLPALTQRLAASRVANAERLIDQLMSGTSPRHARFSPRFVTELILPIGDAILREHTCTNRAAETGEIEHPLRHYFDLAHGASATVAEEFDDIATDEGADGFTALDTRIVFHARDVAHTIANVLSAPMTTIVRVLKALDCDMVLLGSAAADLPCVLERLLAELPVRPDRIVTHGQSTEIIPGSHGTRTTNRDDAKLASSRGASLATAGRIGGVRLTDLADDSEVKRVFFGLLANDGTLPADNVLFTVNAAGAVAKGARSTPSNDRSWTLTTALPARLGVRRLPLAAWPAKPLFAIELIETDKRLRAKGPFKITLERTDGDPTRLDGLRIQRVSDAHGNAIDPAHVQLRLRTSWPDAAPSLETGRKHGE